MKNSPKVLTKYADKYVKPKMNPKDIVRGFWSQEVICRFAGRMARTGNLVTTQCDPVKPGTRRAMMQTHAKVINTLLFLCEAVTSSPDGGEM